jgi:putative glutathione S-transferase
MGLLVDGVWQEQQHSERTTGGRFMRPTTRFRNWVTEDGSPGPSGDGGLRPRAAAITSTLRSPARGRTAP